MSDKPVELFSVQFSCLVCGAPVRLPACTRFPRCTGRKGCAGSASEARQAVNLEAFNDRRHRGNARQRVTSARWRAARRAKAQRLLAKSVRESTWRREAVVQWLADQPGELGDELRALFDEQMRDDKRQCIQSATVESLNDYDRRDFDDHSKRLARVGAVYFDREDDAWPFQACQGRGRHVKAHA